MYKILRYVSITGLPWGLVSSLPRSIQTLVAQSGVDRKSLSIVDTIIRGECFGPPVLLHRFMLYETIVVVF